MKKTHAIYAFLLSMLTACSQSYDEPKYELVKSDPPFEIRQYAEYLEASVSIDGDFEEAGSAAFPILFRYISGSNLSEQEINMTAPVTQESRGEKIQMTSPVTQESKGRSVRVAFVMPSKWTLDTLPKPMDPRVTIQKKAPKKVAVVRYSGTWSISRYESNLEKLQAWIKKENLNSVGEPVWARYDSPFSLWFLRRNEIQIELE